MVVLLAVVVVMLRPRMLGVVVRAFRLRRVVPRQMGMGGRRVRFRIERHEWYIDMMIQFDGYFLVLVQMLNLLVYLLHGNETLPFGVLRSI